MGRETESEHRQKVNKGTDSVLVKLWGLRPVAGSLDPGLVRVRKLSTAQSRRGLNHAWLPALQRAMRK